MSSHTPTYSHDLGVIIVSWNVRDLLQKCLASLLNDLDRDSIESRVIVVDSASRDDTPAMVRECYPRVELIECVENVGFVRGNNIGAESMGIAMHPEGNETPGSPEHLWLLNPDTEVHQGAAKTLVEFMRIHHHCGMCGPKLINPDGTIQHGAFEFPGLIQLALETQPPLWRFRGSQLDGRYPASRYEKAAPFEIGHPLGAAMFARVKAIAQVGMLDPGYEMYAEEIDWAMRMKKAGWERWCVPTSVVVHYGGASSGQVAKRAERIKWTSRQRYYSRYFSPLKRWFARLLIPQQYRAGA